jgi:hypothetical protein
MSKFKDADIEKWPDSWAGFPRDEKCGRAFLPLMKEFIDYLNAQNLSPKTLNRSSPRKISFEKGYPIEISIKKQKDIFYIVPM